MEWYAYSLNGGYYYVNCDGPLIISNSSIGNTYEYKFQPSKMYVHDMVCLCDIAV